MRISLNVLENHRILKLIEFSLDKKSFSVSEALEYTGMGFTQFTKTASYIYCEVKDIDYTANMHEERDWNLTPDAFFQYMSFLEYRDSLKSAKQAKYIAMVSIVITVLLALATVFL